MRFYEEKYPAMGDLVLVEVSEIVEDVARVYVKLVEYDNITAILSFKNWSRRRVDPAVLKSQIRRAKTFIANVIEIRDEIGEIEIMKGNIKPEDAEEHKYMYSRAKTVHSILQQVATKTGKDLEMLYEKIAWPLDKESGQRGLGAYNGLSYLTTESIENLKTNFDIDDKTAEELLGAIKHFIHISKTKIRAEFKLTCTGFDGIEAIKAALKAGLALATEAVPFEIYLKSSPTYVLAVEFSSRPEEALALVNEALNAIETKIKEYNGGNMVLALNNPKVITKGKKNKKGEMDDFDDFDESDNDDSEEN